MKTITTEELVNYKILPFNLYSEFGEKLLVSGEILTPGKLLQLKHLNVIYRDDAEQLDILPEEEVPEPIVIPHAERDEFTKEDLNKIFDNFTEQSKSKDRVIEKFDMNPNQVLKSNTIVDETSILNYKGPINKKAKIDPQNQIKLKAFYHETITGLYTRPMTETANLFFNIRDKLLQDIIFRQDKLIFSSQVKLIGEYEKCHALNVAIQIGRAHV